MQATFPLMASRKLRGTRQMWEKPEPVKSIRAERLAMRRTVMEDNSLTGEQKLLACTQQEAAWDLREGTCDNVHYASAYYFFSVYSLFWETLEGMGLDEEGGQKIAEKAIDAMNGREVMSHQEYLDSAYVQLRLL